MAYTVTDDVAHVSFDCVGPVKTKDFFVCYGFHP